MWLLWEAGKKGVCVVRVSAPGNGTCPPYSSVAACSLRTLRLRQQCLAADCVPITLQYLQLSCTHYVLSVQGMNYGDPRRRVASHDDYSDESEEEEYDDYGRGQGGWGGGGRHSVCCVSSGWLVIIILPAWHLPIA